MFWVLKVFRKQVMSFINFQRRNLLPFLLNCQNNRKMMFTQKRTLLGCVRVRKCFSTLNVAIIGSGPSGFYTAVDLLKQSQLPIKVTIFDKLPTPFGLSRYGVAPDHLEVKNCEETFSAAARSPNFGFVGGVEIGKDVQLADLRKNFNGIVFAYGNSKENLLGIEGEDLPGVINAKDFVGWYNGNVETKQIHPDLSKVEDVTIIGNGNVAMDIARLLLIPYDKLTKSDITNHSFQELKRSNVRNVKIVARRGLLESAFATKEVRELLELEEFGVKFNGIDPEILEFAEPFLGQLERVKKRKIDTILKFMKPIEERKLKYPVPSEFNKSFDLQYLKSPIKITQSPTNPNLLSHVTFQENRIVLEEDEPPRIEAIPSKLTEIKTDLLITSTGFKGIPIPGLPELDVKFDERKGIISNANSRIFNKSFSLLKGLYTTGWIKNHAKGPIVNTLIDSNTVAQAILEDFGNGNYQELKGVEGLTLKKKVEWKDWLKLNAFEIKFGELNGKTRWKVPTSEWMYKIINDTDSVEQQLIKYEKDLKQYK